jgi:aerotaxis receptor
MAKDGSYYWVYALVVPVYDKNGNKEKYLSIRIKPTSHFFSVVKSLYKKLKEIEEQEDGSMEKSYQELIESLKAMGYPNYETFMIDTIIEELKDKDEHLNREIPKEKFSGDIYKLYEIYREAKKIENIYKTTFKKVNSFVSLEKELENKFKYIYEITDELSLIALNSSVESYKLGSTGASFFVVSSEIKKDSERIGKLVNGLRNDMKSLLDIVRSSVLYINISRLEIFAIIYFIDELVEDHLQGSELDKNSIDNLVDLLKALKHSASKTIELSLALDDYLRKTLNYIDEIESIIKELHYIQLNGLVESARLGEQKFSIIFNQVKELVENTTKLIEEILPMIKHSLKEVADIEYSTTKVKNYINQMLETCTADFSRV